MLTPLLAWPDDAEIRRVLRKSAWPPPRPFAHRRRRSTTSTSSVAPRMPPAAFFSVTASLHRLLHLDAERGRAGGQRAADTEVDLFPFPASCGRPRGHAIAAATTAAKTLNAGYRIAAPPLDRLRDAAKAPALIRAEARIADVTCQTVIDGYLSAARCRPKSRAVLHHQMKICVSSRQLHLVRSPSKLGWMSSGSGSSKSSAIYTLLRQAP